MNVTRSLHQLHMLKDLPDHLAERARLHAASRAYEPSEGGQLVIYWMQTAMRLDENPALDVACHLATRRGLPLLVYQGLSARYAYASDRHHTFILEGARDVQTAAQARGLSYALYVERDQAVRPLADLLRRAAVVVVEDMPTGPSRQFVNAAIRSSACPVVAVDTACVVPMKLVGRSYQRAFEFRDATRKLYKQRLKRPWPECDARPTSYSSTELDWITTLTSQSSCIAGLVAACDIDHTIPAVPDTPGGTTAGYARWHAFKSDKLARYADHRNDPLRDASSRMSAYLHYGMVSPLRLARETAERGGPGAEKYLDELLIWRELAYAFCFYRPDHHLYRALPDWARETLAEHLADARPAIYSWETLSRGCTDDEFWNQAQRSLLLNGELHNNVRMTWGKALVNWCHDPKAALRNLVDLNHRYALDGRDPASYGGLLWCLGQFDRPFSPAEPVSGTVRSRPTSEHARRLNVSAYAQHIANTNQRQTASIAVVGAGLAGLFAARGLHDLGNEVTVFEKSPRPTGRMSTRAATHADFDHGAQYFTCRDPRFRRYVDSWIEEGVVAKWNAPIAVYADGQLIGQSSTERLVAVPGMNALGRHLARDLHVQYAVRVAALQQHDGQWSIDDEHGVRIGQFQKVIMALPAPQAAELLNHSCSELARELSAHSYAPCWAVMLNLAELMPVNWGGAFLNTGPLRWVARNQTKPGRSPAIESLVLHAQGDWSHEHFEDEPQHVINTLVHALGEAIGMKLPEVTFSVAHRWRYAMPVSDRALATRLLANADRSLVACGDWASGTRVEGAFLSGAAAVGSLA